MESWRRKVARIIAGAVSDTDIMDELGINEEKLSFLKSDPLIKDAVAQYKKMDEHRYNRALKTLSENSEDVARELVRVMLDPKTPAKLKTDLGLKILDQVKQLSPLAQDDGGNKELIYEDRLFMYKEIEDAMNPDQASGSSTPPPRMPNQ
jgi:hypothetical protein